MVIYTNVPVIYKLQPIKKQDLLQDLLHRRIDSLVTLFYKKMNKGSIDTSENDTKNITYDQIPLKIKQCIDDIVKREGYVTHKIKCEMTSTEGGNYMSFLYKVNITGKTGDSDKGTDMFVKYAMTFKNTKMLDPSTAFEREAYFYYVIAGAFEQLQEDANIPLEERCHFTKHYYSDSEVIVMENVNKRGFKTLNRMDVVPLNVAENMIRNLAKFHALSFVMENKNPEFYETKIKNLKSLIKSNESWLKFANYMNNIVTNALSGEIKHKIRKYFPTLTAEFSANVNPNSSLKSCLCHGDYRLSNIMLDNKTSTVLPVDYQLVHYNNPVKDFIYFITSCTDQTFRRDHLDSLKEIYHCSLGAFLKRFNMDVEEVYPREEFDRAYEKNLKYGLLRLIMVTPFIFVREDDVPEFGDTEGVFNLHNVEFRERIQGLAVDFSNWLDF